MATTIEACLARAEDRRAANGGTSLRPDDATALVSVANDAQHEVVAALAVGAKDFLERRQVVTSGTDANARYDLETLPIKLSRLLRVHFAVGGYPQTDGARLNQVQSGEEAREFAPRFTVRGTTLVEVGSDWAAPAATVNLAIYGTARADDVTGSVITQTLTALIPDRFMTLVELRLARYLWARDEARDPDEAAGYDALWQTTLAELLAFAQGITGLPTASPSPAPPSGGKA